MNHFELEKNLKGEGSREPQMSGLVRQRLDQTYQRLEEEGATLAPMKSGRIWKRPAVATTAAAAVLGVCVFASGFVSPVMADSIRQIPVIGSIFSSMEVDLGLKNAANEGLTSHTDSIVSYQDVKLSVVETVFDGNRAVYALKIAAPNLKDGLYDTGKGKVKLSNAIDDIRLTIPGYDPSDLEGSVQYGGAGQQHRDTLLVERSFKTRGEETAGQIPDHFNASISVRLTGIDHTFTMNVPFTKSVQDVAYLKPEVSKTAGEQSFTIHNIDITPITTNLNYTLHLGSDKALSDKERHQLMMTRIAVFDDENHLLAQISGEGEYTGNRLDYSAHYASAVHRPKFLILKPFVLKDGDFPEKIDEKQFIQGLELKVDVPAAGK